MLLHSFTSWLAFASVAFALPRAEPLDGDLLTRQDGECVNTPRTRQCWSNGYSIDTDFDAKQPPDGVEVKYNLVITNTTIPQPDGSPGTREVHLINGQYPGPLIRAKWGDTLVITVKNDMKDNGTGIHWHGLRQLNSCQHDGVPGVTECPIAPGKTRTYRFRATQFGTTWYHSHWSIQYGQGVVGPLIIDGPASSQYDEDLGALPLTDWYYQSAFMLNERAQNQGRPPTPDNLLVNGTHKNAAGGGTYARISVVKGKKYRLRLINTSVDNYFTVSMDNHPFTVITSDFVPLRPYTAEQVTLAIGQRYDVVFSANQTSDNYWLRIQPGTQGNCGSNSILGKGIQPGAILHYSDATDAEPTKVAPLTLRTACQDEPLASLVPYVPNEVPQSVIGSAGKLDLNSLGAIQPNPATNTTARPFRWLIDGSPHIVNWNDPTLETILAGSEDFHNNSNVHPMQNDDGWYLWWIQTTTAIALPHPIHLHGHDFYILDAKAGATWDGTTTGLNLKNPPRRDTATLPAGGYLLMAFPADNPGMWIMHCHIAWHASQGLSMQFGERYDDIKSSIGDTSEFKKGCDEWDQFWVPGNHPYEQTDSGI